VSRVPPKIPRPGARPLPKARSSGRRRVPGSKEADGFFDDEQLTAHDGKEEGTRQGQVAQHREREQKGDQDSKGDGQQKGKLDQKQDAQAARKEGEAGKDPVAARPVAAASSARPQTDGQAELEKLKAKVEKMEKSSSINPPALRQSPESAMAFLHNAKPAGSFFRELVAEEEGRQASPGAGEEPLDEELLAAVLELRERLKPVAGVARVVPGLDEEQRSVVVVAVEKGFTQASLKAVPEKIRQFETVLAIPYELLPLKRERPAL